MNWSLRGLTRKRPASAGYASVRVQAAYASAAHASAKRGASGRGAAMGSLGGDFIDRFPRSPTRIAAREQEETGQNLENGEPESRRDRQHRRVDRRGESGLGHRQYHD